MTRINANLDVAELTDSHLLAEHREIKRICNRYRTRLETNRLIDQTGKFTLGKGHETFFLDKGGFTLERYIKIRTECQSRNFNVTDFESCWLIYQEQHRKFYAFSTAENDIVRDRITLRLQETKQQSLYRGVKISKEDAISLLRRGES